VAPVKGSIPALLTVLQKEIGRKDVSYGGCGIIQHDLIDKLIKKGQEI